MEKEQVERVIALLTSKDTESVDLGLVTCGEIIHNMNDFIKIRYHKDFPNLPEKAQERIKKILMENAKKDYPDDGDDD